MARRRDHGRDVASSYRSTQNIRRFLHAKCGARFKFDRHFMQWITALAYWKFESISLHRRAMRT